MQKKETIKTIISGIFWELLWTLMDSLRSFKHFLQECVGQTASDTYPGSPVYWAVREARETRYLSTYRALWSSADGRERATFAYVNERQQSEEDRAELYGRLGLGGEVPMLGEAERSIAERSIQDLFQRMMLTAICNPSVQQTYLVEVEFDRIEITGYRGHGDQVIQEDGNLAAKVMQSVLHWNFRSTDGTPSWTAIDGTIVHCSDLNWLGRNIRVYDIKGWALTCEDPSWLGRNITDPDPNTSDDAPPLTEEDRAESDGRASVREGFRTDGNGSATSLQNPRPSAEDRAAFDGVPMLGEAGRSIADLFQGVQQTYCVEFDRIEITGYRGHGDKVIQEDGILAAKVIERSALPGQKYMFWNFRSTDGTPSWTAYAYNPYESTIVTCEDLNWLGRNIWVQGIKGWTLIRGESEDGSRPYASDAAPPLTECPKCRGEIRILKNAQGQSHFCVECDWDDLEIDTYTQG